MVKKPAKKAAKAKVKAKAKAAPKKMAAKKPAKAMKAAAEGEGDACTQAAGAYSQGPQSHHALDHAVHHGEGSRRRHRVLPEGVRLRRNAGAMPDGSVMHAEVLHNSGVIMLGPENPMRNAKAPSTLGGSPQSLYVYVSDVDAMFARATAAGATSTGPPSNMPWGDRMCSVTDPEGHMWAFATFQREVSAEEIMKAMASGPPQS
ncbi:MAG: VOC family protein [Acidobacteriota bacterium]